MIAEKAGKSDIPDIDKKKSVLLAGVIFVQLAVNYLNVLRWNQNWGLGIGEGFFVQVYTLSYQCFAGTSIRFRSGEFLALRHGLFLAKVMPKFFVEIILLFMMYFG